MSDCYWPLRAILDNSRQQEGDNFDQTRRNLRFFEESPYSYRGWDISTSGHPELTPWRPFGISSRIFDPSTPTLHAHGVAKGDNPPPPVVGNMRYFGRFYWIIENSRSIICAKIAKIFRKIKSPMWLLRKKKIALKFNAFIQSITGTSHFPLIRSVPFLLYSRSLGSVASKFL